MFAILFKINKNNLLFIKYKIKLDYDKVIISN